MHEWDGLTFLTQSLTHNISVGNGLFLFLCLSSSVLNNPQGFYCPEGTSAPEPCPEGTYSSRPALSDRSECSPCGGGQYCTGVGLKEPSGSCQERFYCREGAKSAVRQRSLNNLFNKALSH